MLPGKQFSGNLLYYFSFSTPIILYVSAKFRFLSQGQKKFIEEILKSFVHKPHLGSLFVELSQSFVES